MGMFGFLPHALFTNHMGANTTGLSPRLWRRVTGSLMEPDGSKRLFLVGDDFAGVHTAGTLTDLISELPYVIYSDDTTNHKVRGAADENGGVLQLHIDSGASANEEIGIELGDAVGQLGQISDTSGADHVTAFETRVKVSSITTGQLAMVIGLASPATAADGGVIDTNGGPKADKAFIGFSILADDGDSIDFCYQGAGQTRQDKIAGVAVPVADTFVKLGFLYDPKEEASKRIKVFVNNVEQSTYVTSTEIAAATFPDAEALTFACIMKGIAGSVALETAIDWWAFGQVLS